MKIGHRIITVLPVGEFDEAVYTVKHDELTLEVLQKEVGGYIQTCAPAELREHNIEMLCDEEGLLKSRLPNQHLYPFFYVGNVVFVGVEEDELVGLTNEQIEIVRDWLNELRGWETL